MLEEQPDWQLLYEHSGKVQAIVEKALEKIRSLYPSAAEEKDMNVYDELVAREALAVLNQRYPNPANTAELKHGFKVEPSDESLITALEAMKIEALISAKDMYASSPNGNRRLEIMTDIRLTAEGRKRAQGNENSLPQQAVHNYHNYGNAAAIGPNAVGTFNFQQQWLSIGEQTDLDTLVKELDNAINQLRSAAESSDDYRQLQVLAEAKEKAARKDGSGMLESLSKLGQGALPILGRFGALGIAKLIEHCAGTKLF